MTSMPAADHQHQALAEFAESADEAAFSSVVEEFGGLVFTSAARRTSDRELARDVAQNVFAIAARKAAKLATHPSLSAWFYTTTRLEAAKALRTRQRHQRRVEAFSREMQPEADATAMTPEELESWRDALPALDDSLDRLRPAERAILLERFFEGKSFKEIAARSGRSEAACKMSLRRSLDKMRGWLSVRGVTLSASAIGSGLAAEFAEAAPAQLVASLPAKALAASSSLGNAVILTNTLNTMSTIKSTGLAALAVLALGAVPVALQQSQARQLDAELASLRQRISQPPPRRSIHDRREIGGAGAAGRPAPVARFLAEMQRPLAADELIEQLISATMSQDMGRIMRVLMPLAQLTPAEGQELLAQVRASDKSPQMKDMALQMLSMMVAQPSETPSETLDRHLDNGVDPMNLANQLRDWAKEDPSAAIAWFESRRQAGQLAGKGVDSPPQHHLLIGLVGGLADTDPDLAIGLLEGAEPGTRQAAISEMVTALAGDAETRDQALALALSITSPEARSRAAGRTAASLVRLGQFDAASAFVLSADLDPAQTASAIGSAAFANGGEVPHSFEERVAWAMHNSPEGARPQLIRELAREAHFRHSPEMVSTWVDSLPEGPQRDAGLAGEASALYTGNQSERALQRAQAIAEPELRADTVKRIFTWLNHFNAAAAKQLATEHGWEIQHILNQ